MTDDRPTPTDAEASVPDDQQLGCLLWKAHYTATQGIGDGSVTWWTLQPIERMWWLRTAENFVDSVWLAEHDSRVREAARAEALAPVLTLAEQWERSPWDWLRTTAAPALRAAVEDSGALARIRAEAEQRGAARVKAAVEVALSEVDDPDGLEGVWLALADADTTAHDRPLGSDAPSAHGGVASSPHGESPQGDHSPVAGTPTAHDRAAAVREGGER